MAGRNNVVTLATVIVLVTGTAAAWTVLNASATRRVTTNPQIGAYRALLPSWLAQGEMRFARLNKTESARVRVSPADAARTAEAQYSQRPGVRVVFESLGGYVDANQIVHDWVGTRSWIPPVRPAYFVRLAGVNIPSLGPRIGANHHVDVIVNAVTGRIICAVSFN
ncbi:MAG TPA: hypothetical protein VLS91_02910 [Acidimicrobiales bacterium]|nr:hypothetical protein [Acidimicrobiales bacterium]